MTDTNKVMVRVYFSEEKKILATLFNYLHEEINVERVAVFRAIEGFGPSKTIHTTSVLDLSMDLPIVIEFYADAAIIRTSIKHIKSMLGSGRIISWPIQEH